MCRTSRRWARGAKRERTKIQHLPRLWAEAALQERARGEMPKREVQTGGDKAADAGLVKGKRCPCCGGTEFYLPDPKYYLGRPQPLCKRCHPPPAGTEPADITG